MERTEANTGSSASVPSQTSRGLRAGTEQVSGIAAIKKAIYDAGGDDIAVAVAMAESKTMDKTDEAKWGDAANYTRFNMNWYSLRVKLYPWLGEGDAWQVTGDFTNDVYKETKKFMEFRNAWGSDFYKIHRGGESALYGAYQKEVADYEDAIKFTAEQLANHPEFRYDDTRIWVEVPYI